MNNKQHQLVFCDNCSTLAMALLKAAPLCSHCLLCEIELSDDPDIIENIEPLYFAFQAAPDQKVPDYLPDTAA